MLHFGVKHFVDLTEEGELKPYCHLLPKDVTYLRFPIPDSGVPQSIESVNRLLDKICDLEKWVAILMSIVGEVWGGPARLLVV